jgi:hypothetical protein
MNHSPFQAARMTLTRGACVTQTFEGNTPSSAGQNPLNPLRQGLQPLASAVLLLVIRLAKGSAI